MLGKKTIPNEQVLVLNELLIMEENRNTFHTFKTIRKIKAMLKLNFSEKEKQALETILNLYNNISKDVLTVLIKNPYCLLIKPLWLIIFIK